MHQFALPAARALAIVLCSVGSVHAVGFNNVVTLGDSLLDDANGGRSPVFAELIAQRLNVPVTKFAMSGATSTSLIAAGQHTDAAAMFGPGDVAFVWIGGNDFFDAGTSIVIGNFAFMDTLEANVDLILSTLDTAGMDIVIMNLPDFAKVPGVINVVPPFLLPQFTAASSEWRDRVNSLAATYGAVVVDIFTLFDELKDDPTAFAVSGNFPVPAPEFGDIDTCAFCIFFDEIHPSSMSQGFIANNTMVAMNAAFDPGGLMPLAALTDAELFGLVPIHDICSEPRVLSKGSPAAVGYNVLPQVFDSVEASCQPAANDDLWFVYHADCEGMVTVNTNGSDYDTVLSAYTRCGGTEVACDDDTVGTTSSISFAAAIGENFLIRLANDGVGGRYEINVSCQTSGQVPAVSSWGAIIFALSLLVVGSRLWHTLSIKHVGFAD